MKRKYEQDGLIYIESTEPDSNYDFSDAVNPANYRGEPQEDIDRYIEQDKARFRAYERGEWYPMVLSVEIALKTPAQWAVPTIVGRAYLGRVESDSDAEHIEAEFAQLRAEALHDARQLLDTLANVLTAFPELRRPLGSALCAIRRNIAKEHKLEID